MTSSYLSDLEQAATETDFVSIHQSVIRCASDHLQDETDIWDLMARLSTYHDTVSSRVLALATEQTADEGYEFPRGTFCWLVLGSRGRQEPGIWTDQDTGLIYTIARGEVEDDVHHYYEHLADVYTALMINAGYPECSGYVLARNPRWRGTPDMWRERLSEYMHTPTWAHARFLMLAADMRSISGDRHLFDEVHDWLGAALVNQSFIHWQVADHEVQHHVALNFFQRIQTMVNGEYKGQLDVKNGLYMQVVNALRLWGVRAGVLETSSHRRLHGIWQQGYWDDRFAQDVEDALAVALRVRLEAQLAAKGSSDEANYLPVDRLPKQHIDELRMAMQTVRNLQQLGVRHFRKRGVDT